MSQLTNAIKVKGTAIYNVTTLSLFKILKYYAPNLFAITAIM